MEGVPGDKDERTPSGDANMDKGPKEVENPWSTTDWPESGTSLSSPGAFSFAPPLQDPETTSFSFEPPSAAPSAAPLTLDSGFVYRFQLPATDEGFSFWSPATNGGASPIQDDGDFNFESSPAASNAGSFSFASNEDFSVSQPWSAAACLAQNFEDLAIDDGSKFAINLDIAGLSMDSESQVEPFKFVPMITTPPDNWVPHVSSSSTASFRCPVSETVCPQYLLGSCSNKKCSMLHGPIRDTIHNLSLSPGVMESVRQASLNLEPGEMLTVPLEFTWFELFVKVMKAGNFDSLVFAQNTQGFWTVFRKALPITGRLAEAVLTMDAICRRRRVWPLIPLETSVFGPQPSAHWKNLAAVDRRKSTDVLVSRAYMYNVERSENIFGTGLIHDDGLMAILTTQFPLLPELLVVGAGHLVLAGGAIVSAIHKMQCKNGRVEDDHLGDLDFFFVIRSAHEAQALLERLMVAFKGLGTVFLRSGNAITCRVGTSDYQFVLRV